MMRHSNTDNNSQPFKWLVALAIFMLVLGFTTADVFGLNVPPSKYHGGSSQTSYDHDTDGNFDSPNDPGDSGDDNPESIPEPGTIILLATGLGAAYGVMRKKTK